MKMMFKWMCAIIVVVMSTYVFTACGDDSDDPTNPNAPSSSSIVGTWEVVSSPVTKNGPTKGTLFYMASNGVMKMQLGGTGEVNTGRYSYIPATGLLTPSFEGVRTGTAVLSMRSDGKISMQVSESDNNYTLILEKKSSNDIIQSGEGGGGDSGNVQAREIIGTWIFLYDEGNINNSEGITIVFNEDGTGYYYDEQSHRENITFTSSYDNKGRIRAEWTYQVNGAKAELKAIAVQGGNVLNGEGRMRQDDVDFAGVTMMRKGYTIPSEGILGRWKVIDANFNGPRIGSVLVFANNNEFYTEGDAHADTYDWNATTKELVIHLTEDGDRQATVEANGWTTGSEATVTLAGGDGTLTLKKL